MAETSRRWAQALQDDRRACDGQVSPQETKGRDEEVVQKEEEKTTKKDEQHLLHEVLTLFQLTC